MGQGPFKRSRGRNSGRKQHVPHRGQVVDSNGPEVRVRGTPFQVHEKYLQLARDAGASGDRIAAENLLQHAEHYFRMCNVANAGDDNRRGNGQMRPGGPQSDPGSQPQPDMGSQPQPDIGEPMAARPAAGETKGERAAESQPPAPPAMESAEPAAAPAQPEVAAEGGEPPPAKPQRRARRGAQRRSGQRTAAQPASEPAAEAD